MNPRIFSLFPRIAAATLFVSVVGCQCPCETQPSSQPTGNAAARPSQPGASAVAVSTQESFASAEDAAAAFKQAVRERDRNALLQIFGAAGQPLIFSGDQVQDEHRLASLDQHLSEQLRVDHPTADKAVLYIGAQNWPMPIPVVQNNGQWTFDTAAGKDEILNRRIGKDELDTIAVCQAFVRAEQEYAMKDRNGDQMREYAAHFRSSPGKHDGLYWDPAPGEDLSPLDAFVADAEAQGYQNVPLSRHHQPYHGYFFHILTRQGADAPGGAMDYKVAGHLTKGFALVAYPAVWGNSGIMTFMVNQDGKVLQKNLGAETSQLAPKIEEYNPDSTWQPAVPAVAE